MKRAVLENVVIPPTIRDLTLEDLPSCAWSGSATHLASVATALERARRGEVDYLAVCPPSGLPVGLGGIDYAKTPGAGTLWQLAVHEALQSCGTGTILIQAAEQRIRARGLHRAEPGVEECNPRACALYGRLGYLAYGREPASWEEEAPDGSLTRYEMVCHADAQGTATQPGAAHWGPSSASPPAKSRRRGGHGGSPAGWTWRRGLPTAAIRRWPGCPHRKMGSGRGAGRVTIDR